MKDTFDRFEIDSMIDVEPEISSNMKQEVKIEHSDQVMTVDNPSEKGKLENEPNDNVELNPFSKRKIKLEPNQSHPAKKLKVASDTSNEGNSCKFVLIAHLHCKLIRNIFSNKTEAFLSGWHIVLLWSLPK